MVRTDSHDKSLFLLSFGWCVLPIVVVVVVVVVTLESVFLSCSKEFNYMVEYDCG